MKLKGWGQTDVGLKRAINQDSILVDDGLGLFVVADGMGGHKGGEVASAIAVQSAKEIVKSCLEEPSFSPRDVIREIFVEASHRIFKKSSEENPSLAGMGTTMVLCLYYEGTIYVGNVGDSRCYLFNNNLLWQLTEDHSLINEQVRAGVITEDEIDLMVGKNVITRSVGYEREVQVDIVQRKIVPGEKFLLCSDGLCGLVSDALIENVLKQFTGRKSIDYCIELAKEAGGDDNVSVVLIEASKA
jgi:serine/threonine protein phosphatase PrpC